MHAKTAEMEKAVVATTTARIQNHQTQGYGGQNGESRASLFEQAVEVLLVLQHPLSATSRLGFWALFDHRLRRAYEEVRA